jgi:hypothetical protein
MDDRGIGGSIVSRVFIIIVSKAAGSALGPTQAAIQLVPVCNFPVIKRTELEADQSASPEVKVFGVVPPPSYFFRAWYLSKHRGKLFYAA